MERIFQCRASALHEEQCWVVKDDRLVWLTDGVVRQEIFLRDVIELRLLHQPSRFADNRYCCEIVLSHGARIHWLNQHYTGFAHFEDRSAAYREFVETLIERITIHQPSCVFRGGVSAVRWWLNAIFSGVVTLVLLVMVIVLWFYVSVLVLIKVGLIAIFVPRVLRWFSRNRPQVFRADAIPTSLLPKINQ